MTLYSTTKRYNKNYTKARDYTTIIKVYTNAFSLPPIVPYYQGTVDYALSGLDYEPLAAAGTTINTITTVATVNTVNTVNTVTTYGRTAQDKYTERLVYMEGTTVSFARPKWGKPVSKLVSSKPVSKPVSSTRKPTMSGSSCNSSSSTRSSDSHTSLASTVAGETFDQHSPYSPYSPYSHGQVSVIPIS